MADLPFVFTARAPGVIRDGSCFALESALGLGPVSAGISRLAAYGITDEERRRDVAEARQLENRILPPLTRSLNKLLEVDFDQRQWQILLGHWIRRSSRTFVNRRGALNCALREIGPFRISRPSNLPLPAFSSWESLWAYTDPVWAQYLCARIAEELFPEILVEQTESPGSVGTFRTSEPEVKMSAAWKKRLALLLGNRWAALNRKSKYLIISTYLGRSKEVGLNLSLLQMPAIWPFIPLRSVSMTPDPALRDLLQEELSKDDLGSPELKVLFELTSRLLPIVFLEGFRYLEERVDDLEHRLPKNPRVIFASNRFDTDDEFKLWVARRVRSGSKYVVGQHGASYGTDRFESPNVEEETCDNFLTWGQPEPDVRCVPAFNFRRTGSLHNSRVKYSQGRFVVLHQSLAHDEKTWDVSAFHHEYLDDLVSFLKQLESSAALRTELRFYPSPGLSTFNEKDFILSNADFVGISDPAISFRDLLKSNNFLVFTYDSTGLLESLTANRPAIAFWQNSLEHLRDEVRDDYVALIEAKIVHLSAKSAAEHINSIHHDVESWWWSKETQAARNHFSDKYARPSSSPIRTLRKIIREIEKGDNVPIGRRNP